MNVYAYCLSQEADWSALEAVTGLAGERPFVLSYGEIVAVVSKPPDSPIAVTRENVLAHERVISHVFAQTTPLPFRFGGLLRSGELDRYVEANRDSLLGLLARVRGAVEMSVKIIHEHGSEEEDDAVGRTEPAEPEKVLGQGAMFLAAKQRESAESKLFEERAREIANWLKEQLAGIVKDSFLRLTPTRGMAVKAAYLVERPRLEEYRDRLKFVREQRPELLFLTSGPWPPYSFCDLIT